MPIASGAPRRPGLVPPPRKASESRGHRARHPPQRANARPYGARDTAPQAGTESETGKRISCASQRRFCRPYLVADSFLALGGGAPDSDARRGGRGCPCDSSCQWRCCRRCDAACRKLHPEPIGILTDRGCDIRPRYNPDRRPPPKADSEASREPRRPSRAEAFPRKARDHETAMRAEVQGK